MSLNENQPEREETHCPVCGEFLNQGNCSVHGDASKAGVEEQSSGIPDAKADNVEHVRQNTLQGWLNQVEARAKDAQEKEYGSVWKYREAVGASADDVPRLIMELRKAMRQPCCLTCKRPMSEEHPGLFFCWTCDADDGERIRKASEFLHEIVAHATCISWNFDEQQRDPIHAAWKEFAQEALDALSVSDGGGEHASEYPQSPAVAPSVVEGVEEKRWNVDAHIFYTRIMQGDTCVTVINGVHNEGCAKQICSAHNASLGEPREKEDLGEKEPSSAMVSVLQNAPALHSANIWHAAKQLAQYRDLQLYNFLNVAVGFLNELAVKIILSSHSNAVLPHPVSETKDLGKQEA